jgi:hypothetical protein
MRLLRDIEPVNLLTRVLVGDGVVAGVNSGIRG